MSSKKVQPQKSGSKAGTPIQVIDHSPLFGRTNYLLMVAGAVIVAVGMLLMAGGKSPNPTVFDYKQVYSTTRVTVAPLLIMAGLAIEVYAIFKK
jgi:hypothetical protein